MRPSLALKNHSNTIREMAPRYCAANVRVFGSVARGTDMEGSDVDLLVDALPGATLFDLGGLQADIEDLLGVRVDLLTPNDLPPHLRQKIVSQAIPL